MIFILSSSFRLQEEIFSSSFAAASYLKSINFHKKVYIVGESGISEELKLVHIASSGGEVTKTEDRVSKRASEREKREAREKIEDRREERRDKRKRERAESRERERKEKRERDREERREKERNKRTETQNRMHR